MRAPRPFDRFAVDEFRPSPTFRAPQNYDRPDWRHSGCFDASLLLNKAYLIDHRVKQHRHQLVHGFRFVTFDKMWLITVSGEQANQLIVAEPSQHGGIRDLISVQMEDGKHSPVACRIEKLIRMPTGGERSRFRLAITHYGACDQVRIVKDCTVGVH